MKIFIISSASFYDRISPIKEYLEKKGFDVIMPNTYESPNLEQEVWQQGHQAHADLIKKLFKMSEEKIANVDAVLCINFKKRGVENYIGGSTFIEIYEAFKNGKKIFLYHDIPVGMLYDEIAGFDPIIINENLDLIK